MHWMNRAAALAAFGMLGIAVMAIVAPAFAAAPEPWQLGMQPAGSPIKERIEGLHDLLLVIITMITTFVLILLVYTMWRFRASRNPVPTRTAHNTLLEVAWTVIPVLILVIIAIPSFKLLYYQDRAQDAEMTIKVVGHQWYWSYEYPDHGDLRFDSYMVQDEDLQPGQKRLLEVDNRLVLPVDTTIRVLVAGTDVIHSWFVPSLGVQIYSLPGRLNETWVRVDKPGVYYGQCNQICGINHAFMPIAIEAVSKEEFARWLEEAKQKFAAAPADRPIAVAANAAR
jgi:cytochrome c oxidase, subunit II